MENAKLSRRGFIAASGAMMAGAASAAFAEEPPAGEMPAEGEGMPGGEGMEGGPAGGPPMFGADPGEPYSGPDDVMRTDENGNNVYYSMRRNWVGEPPVIDESQITQVIECDVAIMGVGYAGSQCFRMACEKGLTVVAADPQYEEAYNTYGGDLGHFNSQWQEVKYGIARDYFDPWDFIDSYQLQSAGRAQPDLLRKFAYRNGEIVDWMMELQPDLSAVAGNDRLCEGYVFKKGYFWTYPTTIKLGSGAFSSSGEFCMASMRKGIEASPDSQVLWGHTGVVICKENGVVTGCIAHNNDDDTYVRINARKGVVIATGDFSGNSDMYSALCTECQETNPYDQLIAAGRDGSGIKMGIWAGGVMEVGPRSAMGGQTSANTGGFFGAAAGLWLNKYGKRFCNEAFGIPFVAGVQAARQPIGASMYQVWDNGHMRQFAQSQALGHFNCADVSDEKVDEYEVKLAEAYAAGAEGANGVYAADDLETLASYLGLEGDVAANFVASVERYNAFAEAGKDEDYAKPADMLFPINEPPYYAEVSSRDSNRVLVTLSGLYIDGDGAVLDQNFEPIPGLFATGNASGGRFPLQYTSPMNGLSIGFATVYGALLGEYLGTEAPVVA